ncbi:MAG: 1,4-dihydroxy-2-naphthoate octaprenyltransferase [Parashewanella sp.]
MHIWLLAIRPKTLSASISPILIGNVLAFTSHEFTILTLVFSLLCALSLQITVNLVNDYADAKTGVDNYKRLGPVRASQAGLLSKKQIWAGISLSTLISILTGLCLVSVGGLPILMLGIASILCAFMYSLGPKPLACHAMGELFVFLFFGLIAVTGSYFLQTGTISVNAVLMGSALGLLNAAIMLVNNTRDIITDKAANKITLAVLIGKEMCCASYRAILFLAFALLVSGFLLGSLPGLPVLLAGICFVYARKLTEMFEIAKGAEFNHILHKTSLLTLIFSLLFCSGYLITTLHHDINQPNSGSISTKNQQ